ncbi:MAG: TM2 domain-containing protein [bacterium]
MHERSVAIAYILWFFFGFLGIHRFYCGKTVTGIIWLCTGGLFAVGWIIDLFIIPGMVETHNLSLRVAMSEGSPKRVKKSHAKQPRRKI